VGGGREKQRGKRGIAFIRELLAEKVRSLGLGDALGRKIGAPQKDKSGTKVILGISRGKA